MKATLHTDGGARGNPGPSGIGVVLALEGQEPKNHAAYLGEKTNNHAEYVALREGLKLAYKAGVTDLICYLDSELVVKQLNGQYRVKHPDLIPLHSEIKSLVKQFSKVSFKHVLRAKNKQADKLVNEAIDRHLKI